MDWTLALERNHTILLRNVAWLFTWLGLEVGGSVETLPRLNRLTVLFVLRPSESAYRRAVLIAMYIRGIVAPAQKDRAPRSGKKQRQPSDEGRSGTAPPAFKLTDPRKRFDLFPNRPKFVTGPGPWITDFGSDNPLFDRSALYAYQERRNRAKKTEGDEDNAKALCSRMNALMAALQDLDGQALRMAKLLARIERRAAGGNRGKPILHPLRPGLPPGYRQRQKHEVDDVLTECHRLAFAVQIEFSPP